MVLLSVISSITNDLELGCIVLRLKVLQFQELPALDNTTDVKIFNNMNLIILTQSFETSTSQSGSRLGCGVFLYLKPKMKQR